MSEVLIGFVSVQSYVFSQCVSAECDQASSVNLDKDAKMPLLKACIVLLYEPFAHLMIPLFLVHIISFLEYFLTVDMTLYKFILKILLIFILEFFKYISDEVMMNQDGLKVFSRELASTLKI